MRDSKESVKFMQVLDRAIFLRLKEVARARGVTVQELIRVLVIPDWMRRSEEDSRRGVSRRVRKRLRSMGGRPASVVARVRPSQRRH